MTKTLKQIQEENRKFILEAIHGCSYEEALKIEGQEIKPLTLSRVLLALPSELYYYKSGNLLYIAKPNQDPKEQITWDLTKETLEEQTEETQREINKIFIGE